VKVFADGQAMHSASRRLKVLSTSSGTSEFYGLTGAAEELVNFIDIFEFLGYSVDADLCTDSAAAKGMCQRVGAGAVKHIETRSLWIQDMVKRKVFRVVKVDGKTQCADLGTKSQPRDRLVMLREACGVCFDVDPSSTQEGSDEMPAIIGALSGAASGPVVNDNNIGQVLLACIALLVGRVRF